MKIADNIKCKDFTIKSRYAGSQIKGQEKLWAFDIYYNGKLITTAWSKTEAKAIVSKKVKEVNAILNKARKLQAD